MFRYQGASVVNEKGKVLEVTGNVDTENRNIGVNKQQNGLWQQWDIVYADEWKGEPGKGELNEDFGLYVERDFYVVSEMKSNKYLDLINNRNFVLKTANGRKTQVWYFHQQTLTIRTRYNNQSWDIKSSGKTSDMQIWSTNSRWWQLFKYTGK
jgi:type IV secretory pathway VirD2 relaxase